MNFTKSTFLTFFLAALFSSSAFSFTSYFLYNKDGKGKWAIECKDGTLQSYSGSEDGLSIVGPTLCEGHGGMVGPDDEITERPAEACQVLGLPSRPSRPVRPHRGN